MKVNKIKELAAGMFGVGLDKVWLNPDSLEDIKKALTKDDIRGLIADGLIKKVQKNQQSRGRARILLLKKRKGRKKGPGKRKGSSNSRSNTKENWMKNVRAQRKILKKFKTENPELFEKVNYQDVYRKINGNYFKGKKYVEAFVKGDQ